MSSNWYHKAKEEKEQLERLQKLQMLNFQRLKASRLSEKIESVCNRVNQNTNCRVTFQEIGSRIEIIVDSEKIQDWKHVHVRIEAHPDKIALIYGAYPIPDERFYMRERHDVVSSRPTKIEPEEITEVDIESWIGNVSEDRILKVHLYNHDRSYANKPSLELTNHEEKNHKPMTQGFQLLMLMSPGIILILLAMIIVVLQPNGCM